MPVVSFPKGKTYLPRSEEPQRKRGSWMPKLGCHVSRISYEPTAKCGVVDILGTKLNVKATFVMLAKLDPEIYWLDVYAEEGDQTFADTYFWDGDEVFKCG